MQCISAEMISLSSNTAGTVRKSWSRSMEVTCFVARSPAALASFVGTPIASCGVLTITFVALANAAAAAPHEITPKALASSCGNPPIHWWKTVVTRTSWKPYLSR